MTPVEKLTEKSVELGQEVRQLCYPVLTNPKFAIWTGSLNNKHHYGKGGLAQHTWEVYEIASSTNKLLNCGVDEKVLFFACLFHDYGKLWDYAPVDETYSEWKETEHKRLIHHISRSAIEWSNSFDPVEYNWFEKDLYHDKVLHAILAHHGCREWGSPVSPFTKVAWLLHLSDSMSARMNDCERVDMIYEK